MSGGLRIVVCGLIGQYPLGGIAWAYMQFVLGLRRLGHDVWYLEDTERWPYDPVGEGRDRNFAYNVGYLRGVMEACGMHGRWAFRIPCSTDRLAGLHRAELDAVLRTADLMVNVSGSLARVERYAAGARLAYVDTDPGFTQLRLAAGHDELSREVDSHDVLFSYGRRWDHLPSTGHRWRPTRPPVVMSEWACSEPPARRSFTTVMNWTSYKRVRYAGHVYGQKDVEFERFLDLPRAVRPSSLEVALSAGKTRRPPRELLAHRGWRVTDAATACGDPDAYRRYIRSSLAEWSVAKHGYVQGRTGWFSDRSVCYLAAGRPVVVQDTGFREDIPTGEGILSFNAPDEAAEAIRSVESDYGRHAAAARALAEEHFDSDKVLGELVEEALAA